MAASSCVHTQSPAAHVVKLGAEQECGYDVDDREDNPKHHVPLSKHLEERRDAVGPQREDAYVESISPFLLVSIAIRLPMAWSLTLSMCYGSGS